MTPSISLSGIENAIANLNYRNVKSIKYKFIHAIKKFYDSEQSITDIKSINPDILIKKIWDIEDNEELIKSKYKNLSSVKSSVNNDFNALFDKGLNDEGIIIGPNNTFEMSDSAKNRLLDSFAKTIKTGQGISLETISEIFNLISQFLDGMDQSSQSELGDAIQQIKKILDRLSGTWDEEEPEPTTDEEKPEEELIEESEEDQNESEEVFEDDIEEIDEDDLEEVDEDDIEEIDEDELEEIDENDLEEVDEDDIEEVDEDDLEEIDEDDLEEIDEDDIEEIDEDDLEEIDEDELEEVDEDDDIEEIDEDDIEEIDEDDIEEIDEDDIEEIDEDDIEEVDEDDLEEIDEDGIEEIDEDDLEEIDENDIEEIDEDDLEEIDEDDIEEIDEDDLEEIDEDDIEEIDEDDLEEIDEDDLEEIDEDDLEEIDEDDIEEIDEDDLEEIDEDDIEEIDEDDLEEIDEDDLEEIDEDDIEEIDEDDLEEIDEDDIEEIDEDDLEEIDEDDIEEIDEDDLEEIDEDELEEVDEDDIEGIDEDDLEEIDEDDLEEIDEDDLEEIDEDDLEEIDEDDLEEIDEDDIEEIDEDDLEEIDEDDIEEIDEDDITELDKEELKQFEEFKQNQLLADRFDNLLGEVEKHYNQYAVIPLDKYIVGSDNPVRYELKKQVIPLSDFQIGKFPITNSLFQIFIEQTGYKTIAEKIGFGTVYFGRFQKIIDTETGIIHSKWNASYSRKTIKGACWFQPFGPGSTLHNKRYHPVVQVSFEDAMAFASWIGKRLPSEFEWEAAARTANGYIYPWGNEIIKDICNIESSEISDTTSVDNYPKGTNEFGLADCLGNILEWTTDTIEISKNNTQKKQIYNIVKGGSWISDNNITLYSRFIFKPDFTSNILGFRCAIGLF